MKFNKYSPLKIEVANKESDIMNYTENGIYLIYNNKLSRMKVLYILFTNKSDLENLDQFKISKYNIKLLCINLHFQNWKRGNK